VAFVGVLTVGVFDGQPAYPAAGSLPPRALSRGHKTYSIACEMEVKDYFWKS
jgi:hypothetical protein